jgi:hypothetical protein
MVQRPFFFVIGVALIFSGLSIADVVDNGKAVLKWTSPDLTIGDATNSTGSTTGIKFNVGNATKLTLNSAGNVGLGVAPLSGFLLRAQGSVSLGNHASIGRSGNQYDEFGYNIGFTGTNDAYTYLVGDYAASIRLGNGGAIEFRTAPAGAAGGALALSNRMWLSQNGNLGIGTGSAANGRLDVINGSSRMIVGKSDKGKGDAIFLLEGAAGRTLGINAMDFGLITEFGPNFAVADGATSEKYAVNPAKKAPFIRMDAENGSVAVFGEKGSGSGTNYRLLGAADTSLGLFVSGNGDVGIRNTSLAGFRLRVDGSTSLGNHASIGRSGNHYDEFGYNIGFTSTNDAYTYLVGDYAASIRMGNGGAIEFRTAPAGAAGGALALSNRMWLSQNGNLGIGTGSAGNGRLDVINGSSRMVIGKSDKGKGDAIFLLEGAAGRTLGINAANGLVTEIGPNLALSDGVNPDRFAVNPVKKAPFIRMDAENGSVSIYGEKGIGTGTVMRSLSQADVSLGVQVAGTGEVGIRTVPVSGFSLRVDGSTSMGNHASIGRSGNQYDEFGYNIGFTGTADAYTYLATDYAASIRMGNNNGSIEFRTAGANNAGSPLTLNNRMVLTQGGDLGIGTTGAPSKRLDVNGDANINGTLTVASVNTKVWSIAPDYVFENGYDLKSLDKVEAYVAVNKHLPEVPSAKEIKEKGLDLAEMNLVLLKKVEELTLHAIRQEKELRKQSREFAEYKHRHGEL